LRWSLLRALVVAGRAGEAEIDAELDRDKTADGQCHAAATRAALPLARAKEAAWSAVHNDDAPNAILASMISGFGLVSAQNRDLLRPFVRRYFGSLNEIWGSRSPETAKSLITGLYPRLLIEQDIIDRTDAFLASSNPHPVLRRLLLESRYDLICCLKAQALDAASQILDIS
jgi:aminopeptidase N